MDFLLALFLNPDFAKAKEINNNSYFPKDNVEQISIKELSNEFLLKEIPRTTVSDNEKNIFNQRDPFLPLGKNVLGGESAVDFSNIEFKGIANIDGNKVAFIETSKGTKTYQIGQIIEAELKILNIDEINLTIEISDKNITHIIKLKNDDK